MKILIDHKRAVGVNVRIQVKRDGYGVAAEGDRLSPYSFYRIELEGDLSTAVSTLGKAF